MLFSGCFRRANCQIGIHPVRDHQISAAAQQCAVTLISKRMQTESAFTPKSTTRSKINNTIPPADLHSAIVPGLGARVVDHHGARDTRFRLPCAVPGANSAASAAKTGSADDNLIT
jgi:hypothetical protein